MLYQHKESIEFQVNMLKKSLVCVLLALSVCVHAVEKSEHNSAQNALYHKKLQEQYQTNELFRQYVKTFYRNCIDEYINNYDKHSTGSSNGTGETINFLKRNVLSPEDLPETNNQLCELFRNCINEYTKCYEEYSIKRNEYCKNEEERKKIENQLKQLKNQLKKASALVESGLVSAADVVAIVSEKNTPIPSDLITKFAQACVNKYIKNHETNYAKSSKQLRTVFDLEKSGQTSATEVGPIITNKKDLLLPYVWNDLLLSDEISMHMFKKCVPQMHRPGDHWLSKRMQRVEKMGGILGHYLVTWSEQRHRRRRAKAECGTEYDFRCLSKYLPLIDDSKLSDARYDKIIYLFKQWVKRIPSKDYAYYYDYYYAWYLQNSEQFLRDAKSTATGQRLLQDKTLMTDLFDALARGNTRSLELNQMLSMYVDKKLILDLDSLALRDHSLAAVNHFIKDHSGADGDLGDTARALKREEDLMTTLFLGLRAMPNPDNATLDWMMEQSRAGRLSLNRAKIIAHMCKRPLNDRDRNWKRSMICDYTYNDVPLNEVDAVSLRKIFPDPNAVNRSKRYSSAGLRCVLEDLRLKADNAKVLGKKPPKISYDALGLVDNFIVNYKDGIDDDLYIDWLDFLHPNRTKPHPHGLLGTDEKVLMETVEQRLARETQEDLNAETAQQQKRQAIRTARALEEAWNTYVVATKNKLTAKLDVSEATNALLQQDSKSAERFNEKRRLLEEEKTKEVKARETLNRLRNVPIKDVDKLLKAEADLREAKANKHRFSEEVNKITGDLLKNARCNDFQNARIALERAKEEKKDARIKLQELEASQQASERSAKIAGNRIRNELESSQQASAMQPQPDGVSSNRENLLLDEIGKTSESDGAQQIDTSIQTAVTILNNVQTNIDDGEQINTHTQNAANIITRMVALGQWLLGRLYPGTNPANAGNIEAVGNAVGNVVGNADENAVGNAVGNLVANAVGNAGNAVGNVILNNVHPKIDDGAEQIDTSIQASRVL